MSRSASFWVYLLVLRPKWRIMSRHLDQLFFWSTGVLSIYEGKGSAGIIGALA